jgi:hypothetical protein
MRQPQPAQDLFGISLMKPRLLHDDWCLIRYLSYPTFYWGSEKNQNSEWLRLHFTTQVSAASMFESAFIDNSLQNSREYQP